MLLADIGFPIEGERVDDHHRHGRTRDAFEEKIFRGGGKNAMQFFKRQRRQNREGVEMAGVIRHQDVRPFPWKILSADDF